MKDVGFRKTVAAIETEYHGRMFRSRLEARWAVYFDALVRSWDYEVQGYALPSGCYLPDFWLPIWHPNYVGAGYWFEIKPTKPTEMEAKLCWELARHTNHVVRLIAGRPVAGEFEVYTWGYGHPDHLTALSHPDRSESDPWLKALGYTFFHSPVDYLVRNELAEALRLASSARFEHGTTPEPGETSWRAETLYRRLKNHGIGLLNFRGRVEPEAKAVTSNPLLPDHIRRYESELLRLMAEDPDHNPATGRWDRRVHASV